MMVLSTDPVTKQFLSGARLMVATSPECPKNSVTFFPVEMSQCNLKGKRNWSHVFGGWHYGFRGEKRKKRKEGRIWLVIISGLLFWFIISGLRKKIERKERKDLVGHYSGSTY